MSHFEYVMVIVSIILGLGLTVILRGLARLARGALPCAVVVVWGFLLLFLFLQNWWAFWDMAAVEEWNLIKFLFVSFYVCNMYAMTELMLPMASASDTDWLAHFNSVRKWFFGMLAVLVVLGITLNVPSTVGFIALFGVAVLNGVVLISYVRELEAECLAGEAEWCAGLAGAWLRHPAPSVAEITLPVRVMKALGAEILIVSNACGASGTHTTSTFQDRRISSRIRRFVALSSTISTRLPLSIAGRIVRGSGGKPDANLNRAVKKNVLPWPGADSHQISPRCNATIFLQCASPIPVPS